MDRFPAHSQLAISCFQRTFHGNPLKSLSGLAVEAPASRASSKNLFATALTPILSSRIIFRIALAGTRGPEPGIWGGRRRRVGRATVARLGDEPPGPGLDGDQGQRPRPPPGQERRRGAGNAATYKKLRGSAPCPASRLLLTGGERFRKARLRAGRGKDEACPNPLSVSSFASTPLPHFAREGIAPSSATIRSPERRRGVETRRVETGGGIYAKEGNRRSP